MHNLPLVENPSFRWTPIITSNSAPTTFKLGEIFPCQAIHREELPRMILGLGVFRILEKSVSLLSIDFFKLGFLTLVDQQMVQRWLDENLVDCRIQGDPSHLGAPTRG